MLSLVNSVWAGIQLTVSAYLVLYLKEALLFSVVLAGTATGVSITIAYTGIIIGPPIFGHIVDITQSYSLAWLIFGMASAVAMVILLLVEERQDVSVLEGGQKSKS